MRQTGSRRTQDDRGLDDKALQAIVTRQEAFDTSYDHLAQEEEIHQILSGNVDGKY